MSRATVSSAVVSVGSAETFPTRKAAGRLTGRSLGWRGPAIAMAIYALFSLVVNAPAWWHGPNHWLSSGGAGDISQEVWFLASSAHALLHLENPLRTTWINAPYGVDLADNTAMPLVGLLTAPITWIFGPIATYNVVLSFSFFSAASAAMLAARRFVSWMPAAFFAGLVYGFSPYMVGQGLGHLFLTLTFVFPLMVIVLHEILVRQRRSWWTGGAALGLLIVVQLGISAEALVDALLLAGAGVVVLSLMFRHEISRRAPRVAKSFGLALIVSAPFVLWYFVTSRTGPEHVSVIHSATALAGLATNLLGTVIPTHLQAVNFGHAGWSSDFVAVTQPHQPPAPDLPENGSYIGLPLLALLALSLVVARKRAAAVFFAVMAALSFAISLGSDLHVGNHAYALPMPFRIFLKLPLLENAIAVRFSLFVSLFAALMAAMALDGCHVRPAKRAELSRTGGPRRFLAGFSLLLALAGAVALLPAWPLTVKAAVVPSWFTSSYEQKVPTGSTLLTYPMPEDGFSLPMLWQAVGGLRFRIPDGEAGSVTVHWAPLEKELQACYNEPSLTVPPVSSWPAARAELRTYKVDTVVVPYVALSHNQSCAVRYLTTLLGRPPVSEGDAEVWWNVEHHLP